MARPPVEWPIPVYVTEMRERLLVSYQVPAAALASRLLRPIVPAPLGAGAHGRGLVTVAFSSGRCLKSVGLEDPLASEFHLLEILTPARRHGACRPVTCGNYLLFAATDRPGMRRFIRRAVGVPVGELPAVDGADRHASLGGAVAWRAACPEGLPRPTGESPWPAHSVIDSGEAAEALLAHPECLFVPQPDGRAIRSTPLHQYARCTVAIDAAPDVSGFLAGLLGVQPEEVRWDHSLHQRRATHTWFFPPERIPATAQVVTPRRSQPALVAV